MRRYCIISARPKGATSHINSEFRLCEYDNQANDWKTIGWKSLNYVSKLLQDGNEVVTAKIENNTIFEGAPVEVELRISYNKTNYKISGMPDT